MLRVLTDDELIGPFGDPKLLLREDGTVDPHWEMSIITRFPLPAALPLAGHPEKMVTRVRCHHRIASPLRAALDAIYAVPGLWATINDYGGCYEWRLQRLAKKLSRHSWGIAIDLDCHDNPFGDATPQVNPDVIRIFDEYGFAWGGNFHGARVDPMHFEFADLTKL